MKLMSLVLLAAFLANNASADGDGNRKCSGGYSHGAQMEVGRYWYECKDSQMVPKGCLAEDGHRVDIDGTFDTQDYRMQCVLGSDGYLTVIYKSCVLNGGAHDIGSQWDDGTAFFTCVKEGNNVRVVTLGCVDQGRPLKLDERVVKSDFLYQCKKSSDGTPTMNKVGCVYQGRKYTIGETIEGDQFWYTCTDHGATVVGCMYQSHQLKDGDFYTKDDIMYACKVTTDSAHYQAITCLANQDGAHVMKQIGCFWNEGDYQYTCKQDGDTMTKVQVGRVKN